MSGMFGMGLDVSSIVKQLIYVESAPIRALQQTQKTVQQKISAYGDLQSRLKQLKSALDDLNSPQKFSSKSAVSSKPEILTAAVGAGAVAGVYDITVSRLAKADSHASDARFDSQTEALGTGGFDLTVGTTTTTITIDANNNTLAGLRDAINGSGAGATASIIYDGAGYRLSITSKETGSAQAISIDNNTLELADGTAFGFSRTHSIASPAELDASFTVNGLAVTSGSNRVENSIAGVTLNLAGTSANPVLVTVSHDTEGIKSSIEKFVDSYNSVYKYLNSQFTYGGEAGSSTQLGSESLLRKIQNDLSLIVGRSVTGLSGTWTSLRSVGLEVQQDGTLKVNSTKLSEALGNNLEDVRKLFQTTGTVTDSAAAFAGVRSTTQAGSYEVVVTQAAQAASVTSTNQIPGTLGIDETLTFTMGTKTAVVSLTSGMTLENVVAAVNSSFLENGLSLQASALEDRLTVSSLAKGSAVGFEVVSDLEGAGTGFGTTGMSAAGIDVAGTIGGYAAEGKGEYLTGSEAAVLGLKVQYNGSSTSIFEVTVSLGYAELLQRAVSTVTDTVSGLLKQRIETLEKDVKRIDLDIDNLHRRMELREKYLMEEFSRADQALQQLSQLQTTLNAQLNLLGRQP
jgi:flagellar hook-associated protein 2